jgi:hypothetical protein
MPRGLYGQEARQGFRLAALGAGALVGDDKLLWWPASAARRSRSQLLAGQPKMITAMPMWIKPGST